MTWLVLVGVVVLLLWRQRSEGIVTVRTLDRRFSPGSGPIEEAAEEAKDQLTGLMDAIQVATDEANRQSQRGGDKIRGSERQELIRRMVRNNQFLEAMEIYRRAYNVDLATAKRAIDKMALGGE